MIEPIEIEDDELFSLFENLNESYGAAEKFRDEIKEEFLNAFRPRAKQHGLDIVDVIVLESEEEAEELAAFESNKQSIEEQNISEEEDG